MSEAREEAAWLVAAQDGDGRAAAALVDRLGPKLLAFALRMTGGDRPAAEDIVQEAFLRLWSRTKRWDPDGPARLSTWMGRVVANLAIDRARLAKRESGGEPELDPIDPAPSVEDRLAVGGSLEAALDALPDRQRQAVLLRLVHGYSNTEIAEMMGCGVEAVESLTARGKRRLSQLLDETEVGDV
ncbi:MAG: sigma-70 family RNA polymerase sigma factor [Pseudomonadota bacterium]